jgi:ribonucleoside-diphosphate reductase alpha chain
MHVRLWTIVLEISLLMSQFPSKEIALRSYDFRTIGLGYANIGSLLMTMGIPYDSEEALAIVGTITAMMMVSPMLHQRKCHQCWDHSEAI